MTLLTCAMRAPARKPPMPARTDLRFLTTTPLLTFSQERALQVADMTVRSCEAGDAADSHKRIMAKIALEQYAKHRVSIAPEMAQRIAALILV